MQHKSANFHLSTSISDKARRIQELSEEILCFFAPDISTQDDNSWSAIGTDDDVSMDVLHAQASPDGLKLWPWVNRVRCLRQ